MKILLAAVLAVLVGSGQAFALSSSVAGGRKSLVRSIDSNGNPLAIESDKGWKVFELIGTTEVQVLDEASVAPKQGILNKVCIETGTGGVDYALVWDTSSQTGGVNVVNRRLLPAFYAATATGATVPTLNCTPVLNALFTAGLRGMNSAAGGRLYIYWRGLGDVR